MRSGHHAAAGLLAVGSLWFYDSVIRLHDAGVQGVLGLPALPLWVQAGMFLLVLYSSSLPDYDHPQSGISHDIPLLSPAISRVVRFVAWRVYVLTRTAKDRVKRPGDCHRDFTHTFEGSVLLFAGPTVLATWWIPLIGDYATCWGVAVFLGCLSHIAADSLTPSGVPWSIMINALLRRGVWVRYCVGWRSIHVVTIGRPEKWWGVELRLPVLWTGRVSRGRASHTYRGLFHTDSAEERETVIPILHALTAVMLVVATGLVDPLVRYLVPPEWSHFIASLIG